jgi:hypothetical protein
MTDTLTHDREQQRLRVAAAPTVSPEALDLFGSHALQNFATFCPYSTPNTELFVAEAYLSSRLVGLAPVVRLSRRKSTDQLKPSLRKWLGSWLGPVARKTTLLVDTAFLAYAYISPFFSDARVDPVAVKRRVSDFLKSQSDVDSIWISEPAAEAKWAESEGYDAFYMLPMVHVRIAEFDTFEQYLERLSKKRRRNYRQERHNFEAVGARTEIVHWPLDHELLAQLYRCLAESARRTAYFVPYNDVLTNERAFCQQRQMAIVARVGSEVIGFMSFIEEGRQLLQCHGGLDYDLSLRANAYHNLIYASIEYALKNGFECLSMGPLNNETKRRGGTDLLPVVANLWNRSPLDRFVARKLFIKNFHVYEGEVE